MAESPHDAFFKLVFSDPEHAAGELRAVLPPEITTRIPWETLKLVPGSFVDEELARSHTDLLFSAVIAGHEALLYFLFEHLSTVGRLVPFRLLCYEVRIWQSYLTTRPHARRLPVILPIVLHHSEKGWHAETSFEEVLDIAPELRDAVAPFVPRFRFLLDDVSDATDQDLRRRAMTALGKLALVCFRDVRRPAILLANLALYADLLAEVWAAPNGHAAVSAVLKYIAIASRRLPSTEIRKAMSHLIAATTEEETTGTLGDQLREIFMDEGIERGQQRALSGALLRLLRKRFGELPGTMVARIKAADAATLDSWLDRVLTAATLEEVLTEA